MQLLQMLSRWGLSRLQHWRNQWLTRRLGKCGADLSLAGKVFVAHPERVKIGDNVHLGDKFWAQAAGGLEIGNNVIISRNCVVHTLNHDLETANALPYGTRYIQRPVTIGDNVWIGMNVTITPGSIIGEGAVIGMGAVVAGEISPLAIAVGNPIKIVKYRDAERYRRLQREGKRLSDIRGRPELHGWRADQALAHWQEQLHRSLQQKGYVTTEEVAALGADYASALLYHFAQSIPSINFAQYRSGYMAYMVDLAKDEIRLLGQTTIPLEADERDRLLAKQSDES